jgi:hypothetical protein
LGVTEQSEESIFVLVSIQPAERYDPGRMALFVGLYNWRMWRCIFVSSHLAGKDGEGTSEESMDG